MTFIDAYQNTVYNWEGGPKCTNDPLDPGGVTKYGVCARYNPGIDVAGLDDAGAQAIYLKGYWAPNHLDGLSRTVGAKVFDACVNPGSGVAIRHAQIAAQMCGASIVVDGKPGPATVAAINSCDEQAFLQVFCEELADWYNAKPDSPEKREDIHGWLRRAEAIPVFKAS